jgi:uncharacterized protein (TIGR03437 family)
VGEYVTFYATGAGQLSPGGVDGQVTPLSQPYPLPVKSVTATVGGVEAVVGYAGAAPGLVSGVMQVNLQIPAGVLAGPAIVQLTVDTISSPNVVTVVVN